MYVHVHAYTNYILHIEKVKMYQSEVVILLLAKFVIHLSTYIFICVTM